METIGEKVKELTTIFEIKKRLAELEELKDRIGEEERALLNKYAELQKGGTCGDNRGQSKRV